MAGTKGHRGWGSIKRQNTKEPSYQASYVGPNQRRYYAPTIFRTKMNAERWLARERDYRDGCVATGEAWLSPQERLALETAESVTLSEYGKTAIEQRKLAPRTRTEYLSKFAQLIEPELGSLPIRSLTPAAVRAWFSKLDNTKPTRNAHAYGVLSMICNTAVRDGLLDKTPCQVVGALKVTPRKQVRILSTVQLHAVADKLASDDKTAPYGALVLLAAWCGLRFGEVTELRRRDIEPDASVLYLSRAVVHRAVKDDATQRCKISTTKGKETVRTVTVPPHIRPALVDHLATHVQPGPDALLFAPDRGGCHLNDKVFNTALKEAAACVDRSDISAHDLRRFAGTQNAAVGSLRDNMNRLGHKTVDASLRYQHHLDGSDAALAAQLSARALAELNGQKG